MANIYLPLRRPQARPRTEWLRGLTGAWHPSTPTLDVKNLAPSTQDEGGARRSSNVSWGGGPEGIAYEFPRIDDIGDYIAVTDSNEIFDSTLNNTGYVSFAVRVQVDVLEIRSGILAKSINFANDGWWCYLNSASVTWRLTVDAWNAGISITQAECGAGQNDWVTLVGRMDANQSTNNVYLSVNGFSKFVSNSMGHIGTNTPLLIGAAGDVSNSGVRRVLDGRIAWVALWDRWLTDGEVEWLNNHPEGPFTYDHYVPQYNFSTAAPPSGGGFYLPLSF